VVMLGLPYSTADARRAQPGQGRISRYAWGSGDYHDVIHEKLKQLITSLHAIAPNANARGVVDTAPLLEREFAQLSGLGWIGKHTLLIHKPRAVGNALRGVPTPGEGSYFFQP